MSDWRDRAACRGTDPELFFPVARDRYELAAAIEAAKQVCAGCAVVTECLADTSPRDQGIRGGLTEDERHTLRKRAWRAAARARRKEAS